MHPGVSNLLPGGATLVALVLGFALSQAREWAKRARLEGKEHTAIRLLIHLEVAKNRTSLRTYLNSLLKDDNCESEGKFSRFEFASRVERTTLPALSSAIWESQLSKLPEVYSAVELSHLWNYFEAIDEIRSLHAHIQSAQPLAYDLADSSAEPGSNQHGTSFQIGEDDAAGLLFKNITYVVDFSL